MEKDETLYRCNHCRQWLPLTSFTTGHLKRKRARPVAYRCKKCYFKYVISKRPVCPNCNKWKRKLQPNGLCGKCNRKLGMRMCASCKEVKIYLIDFNFGHRCIDCVNLEASGGWQASEQKDVDLL